MSRRRVYEEDDADRGGSRKRRRMSSEPMEIEERLESLILRVGERSTSSLESNLEGLAGVLEADLPNYKIKILRILCDCAVKMPEKSTVYSTLVGLLNARNYNCGGEFMEMMVRNFKDALKACEFENARVLMRFLADLVNCHVISAGSLINLFDSMIDVTLEDNIPQVRSDWYVFAVLSTLPWVGKELCEKKEQDLDRLLGTIENYIMKRQKPYVAALRVWSSDEPHPQEEYLDSLWAQIRKLRNDNWQERHILRPYLAFDGVLCEALQHNLPEIIPPPHHNECTYPYPWIVFRLFDYTDCPEGPVLPGSHSIERFLIEEQLHWIIQVYFAEKKDCAAQLLNFPGKHKVPFDYMVLEVSNQDAFYEVVFAELYHMPHPRNIEIYYGSLLIELCKLQPSTMPQLAQATELLYERIDTMNTSCFDRFVNWFSYHLSNFQFCWSWDEWATCLDLDHEHPKTKFVREVLLKCLRLSYHQRIQEIVPSSFEALLPAVPEPSYKYTAEGSGSLPGTMASHQLIASIRNKSTPEEVLMIIKDLPNPLQEEDTEPMYNPLKIDVFVQTLLNIGSKSISHSFSGIAKFHYVFKTLAPNEEAQICVLRNMFELWHKHQQMMVVLIDKLLKTQIVECFAVANWVFSKEMAQEFTKMYVWEILHLTIRKMNKHVQKLQKEVDDAREKLNKTESEFSPEKIDEKDRPTEEMIERMEERLEAAQADQKNLFLIIFQRFIIILTEHIVKRESGGQDYNPFWYKWTIGRLQQVFLMHHDQVFKYISTLETLLFTSDIDTHILDVFQQFAALRA